MILPVDSPTVGVEWGGGVGWGGRDLIMGYVIHNPGPNSSLLGCVWLDCKHVKTIVV